MTELDSHLEQLVVKEAWWPDWQDVLVRAGAVRHRRVLTRTRILVALTVAAAVIIPLTAIAAANDWWFFRAPGAPTPTSAPVVVKTGVWESHPWQLVAYPSSTDGLCFSMNPGTSRDPSSYGAAMSCGPFNGVGRTPVTKHTADMNITYLLSSATSVLPAHIAGPVIESATTVEIRLSDGTTIHAETFAAPPPLEHVRFYAVPLPGFRPGSPTRTGRFVAPIRWIAGLDATGQVVACLAPADAHEGISPLSACRP